MSCSPFCVPFSEVYCLIEDCYLTFYDSDDNILLSLPLCGAAIKTYTDLIQISTIQGTINLTTEQLTLLGKTIDELDLAIKSCKAQPVGMEEAELNVLKFGTTTKRFSLDDKIYELTECFEELPNGAGVKVTYIVDDLLLTLAELEVQGYELLKESALPKNSTGTMPFHLCGPLTGTISDLLPTFAALNGTDWATKVTGDVPTGLHELNIYQEGVGAICDGNVITAGGVTVGGRSLDDAEGWCKTIVYKDLDCDSYAECIDMTTPIDIPDGAAIVGDGNGILCDADDNDNNVTT